MSRPAKGAPADPARVKTGDKREAGAVRRRTSSTCSARTPRRSAGSRETHRSTRKGKFAQKVARVRAALENFVPEVQPGNTTELSTRAAPFAAYIARMHRSIHKLWGFDQLEAWDELTGSSPLNDPKLATTLEVVINRDGTVDKVTIVRTSGYLGFDAAAIDVALHRRSVSRSAPRDPFGRRQDLRSLDLPPRRTAVHARVHAVLHPRQSRITGAGRRRRQARGPARGRRRRLGDASRPAGAGAGGDAPVRGAPARPPRVRRRPRRNRRRRRSRRAERRRGDGGRDACASASTTSGTGRRRAASTRRSRPPRSNPRRRRRCRPRRPRRPRRSRRRARGRSGGARHRRALVQGAGRR